MKAIKDKKLITLEYAGKLKKHILENQEAFFSKENEADHWRDFDYWTDKKTDRNHLIMPDECLLIDRDFNGEHSYVICRILGSSERSKPRVEQIIRVIKVEELDRNYWRNGYFLLPDLN